MTKISDERVAELIESRKVECNRLSYGYCQTLGCLKRGGYISGPARYDVATCDEYEISSALRELQQRRAQDNGQASGKISDNDGHSLRKREESIHDASPAQQAQPVERGPWSVVNSTAIASDDFTHDVILTITGDFADDAQREAYAQMLALRLNAAPPQDEARELLREASDELDYQTSNDHPLVERIRAYLARTGGKEETK